MIKNVLLNRRTQSAPCLLSSDWEFISSKRSFSLIVQTSSFSSSLLLSNLDWFWSSKRQNNCSHISDEHLLDWSSSALFDSPSIFYLFFFFFWKISASQIWSSGSFEERLFPEALLSLFLSGGMIFISHLLRSVYFFISQSALDCIALYVWIITSHLTKTYVLLVI